MPVDFSSSFEIYDKISKDLEGLDVGILGKQAISLTL